LAKFDLTGGLHPRFPINLNVFTHIWLKLFSFAQI